MKHLVIFAVAGSLLFTAASAVAQWQPALVGSDTTRSPETDIRIQLPGEVDTDTLQWLALEINGIDVSELVSLEQSPVGFIVVVTPPQPLEAGAHVVRLVEYAPDGQIIERGRWTLTTGAGEDLASKSLDVQTTAELGYRIEYDEDVNEPRENDGDFQGDGSIIVNGRASRDDWEVEGEASILYSSLGVALVEDQDDPQADTGDDLDLGEYRLSRRDGVSEINLGHHAIEHDSLIVEDFYRRGVSASRTTAGGRATGTAFAMRAEPTIGRKDLLGIEEVDTRVMGGVVSVSPLGNEDALTLSAAALSGKGNDENGASLVGRDVLAEGDAASISAESRLLDDRVRFRGEFAKTDYDFDGINGDLDKIDDEARMLLAEFTPLRGVELGGVPADLTFGAEYRETGLFFRSIANTFLPADKDMRRLYSDFRRGGFNLSLSAGQEHDNVDDAADLPRLNTDLVQLSTSYTPPPVYTDGGNLETPWYGRPSLSANMQYGRQEQTRLPDDFSFGSIDRRTRSARVSASFNYDQWNWYIGHGLGLENDLTRASPDIRNEISDLGINFFVAQRLFMGLQFQYNRIRQSDGGITRNSLWGVNLDAILIPDTLTGRLNYSMNLDRTSDDSFSSDNAFLNIEFDWQVVQARENRPGLSFWLRGDFQNFDDRLDAGNDITPSQVLLGMRMDWPVAMGNGY